MVMKVAANDFKSMKKIDKLRAVHTKDIQEENKKQAVQDLMRDAHLTSEELKELINQFHTAGSAGRLTEEQFKLILTNTTKNHFASELKDKMMQVLELDENGTIDYNDVMAGLGLFIQGTIDDKLYLCFQSLDVDKKGFLKREQLIQMFYVHFLLTSSNRKAASTSARLVNLTLKELGVKKDVKIDFEIFKKVSLKHPMLKPWLELVTTEDPTGGSMRVNTLNRSNKQSITRE